MCNRTDTYVERLRRAAGCSRQDMLALQVYRRNFCLTLPWESSERGGNSPRPPEWADMMAKHVLVVEDDAKVSSTLQRWLSLEGFRVTILPSGVRLDEKLSREEVDLFLLDLQMPKIDGFGVVAQLRKDPRFANTPIVALTASAMHGENSREPRSTGSPPAMIASCRR